MLWEISVTVKHLIKKASPALLNRRRDSGSRAENVREFSSGARIRLGMTVSEMLETVHENDLFDMFPEFSFSALRRLKTYLRSTKGQ